ncbi:Protein of unknown function [Gryllus bimaculatus]|nr:Protein of unknown function [Gryllus bimaculatus]
MTNGVVFYSDHLSGNSERFVPELAAAGFPLCAGAVVSRSLSSLGLSDGERRRAAAPWAALLLARAYARPPAPRLVQCQEWVGGGGCPEVMVMAAKTAAVATSAADKGGSKEAEKRKKNQDGDGSESGYGSGDDYTCGRRGRKQGGEEMKEIPRGYDNGEMGNHNGRGYGGGSDNGRRGGRGWGNGGDGSGYCSGGGYGAMAEHRLFQQSIRDDAPTFSYASRAGGIQVVAKFLRSKDGPGTVCSGPSKDKVWFVRALLIELI